MQIFFAYNLTLRTFKLDRNGPLRTVKPINLPFWVPSQIVNLNKSSQAPLKTPNKEHVRGFSHITGNMSRLYNFSLNPKKIQIFTHTNSDYNTVNAGCFCMHEGMV